ncbi:MAG: YwaF family protein [bacterium]|nr:YwaF family protein [bacterium]
MIQERQYWVDCVRRERYMGQMFDFTHTAYIIISLSITGSFVYFGSTKIKSQGNKDIVLKFFALATFFLHTSVLWVDFLKNGQAMVPDNVLFPIYFCNLSMYMLVIVAFMGNKSSKWFKWLAIMASYGGIFGALISLFYPVYYLGAPSMFEWGVFKSMVSHSTMLAGGLWLLANRYFKISTQNIVVYFIGLLWYGLIGIFVNFLFKVNGLHDPNAMYLQHPPLEDVPYLNAVTISILMCLIMYVTIKSFEWAHKKSLQKNMTLSKA